MDEYKDFLAVNVLNEERIVSYRTLSRALKVHSNLAKQLLYDFHHKQNAKRPGSLHATYLITGRRKPQSSLMTNGRTQDGEDTVMESSPFPSSMPEHHDSEEEEKIVTTTIVLAKEEQLEKAKSQFEEIISIHIYSLEPNTLKSLQVLSDCNREIASKYSNEDPLEAWKQYGTIQNPNVKRRTGRRPPVAAKHPAATAAATKPVPKDNSAAASKSLARTNSTASSKNERPSSPLEKQAKAGAQDSQKGTFRAKADTQPASKSSKAAPAPRRQISDIFKNQPPKAKKQGAESSKEATPAAPSPAEDATMMDVSDDEDDAGTPAVPEMSKEAADAARRAKAERKEKLNKMMDEEDEPMEDVPPPAPEEPESPIEDKPAPKEPEKKEEVTVSGGRRRGRRRVMKKKTMKDEEGYLVTKEELVWESFSEDEPQPKKARMPSTTSTLSTAKGKKGGGKGGHGNIMSFFTKK